MSRANTTTALTPYDTRIVRVGMGGWDLPPFAGVFYPPRVRKGFRKLEFYSQFFDFVEVNVTFYRTDLSRGQVLRWADDVAHNRRFIFTFKLFQGFTHTFSADREDVRNVLETAETLAGRNLLGGIVAQFPYSYQNTPDRRAYLLRLAKALRPHRLFVEMRHDSWNSPLMYNFFEAEGLHLINTDLPRIKRHMPLNALALNGEAYFRMMGRNADAWDAGYGPEPPTTERYDYRYDDRELEQLMQLIRRAQENARTTYVVFHNDPNAFSLVNGLELRRKLGEHKKFLVPARLAEAHPSLAPFAVKVNTEHSFFTEEPAPLRRAV